MNLLSNLPLLGNRREATRRPTPDLAAYYWNGSGPKQGSIRDISATGVYLLTPEKFKLGARVSLTLQRLGASKRSSEEQFAVEAKAARFGKDGVGLQFLLPDDMDLRLFENPLKKSEDKVDAEDIVREFRTAGALVFLRQICPSAASETKMLLRQGLSNYRVASATEIALKAEKMLPTDSGLDKAFDNPYLVLRILEDGSWSDCEHSQRLWAGLLASSCSGQIDHASNLSFVDILSQMTHAHMRIFAGVCSHAEKYVSGQGKVSARQHKFQAADLVRIAGVHDLIKIDRDLVYLAELGLVTPRERHSYSSLKEEAEFAPTALGLELYARCHGHHGEVEDFYQLVSSDTAAGIGIRPKGQILRDHYHGLQTTRP